MKSIYSIGLVSLLLLNSCKKEEQPIYKSTVFSHAKTISISKDEESVTDSLDIDADGISDIAYGIENIKYRRFMEISSRPARSVFIKSLNDVDFRRDGDGGIQSFAKGTKIPSHALLGLNWWNEGYLYMKFTDKWGNSMGNTGNFISFFPS